MILTPIDPDYAHRGIRERSELSLFIFLGNSQGIGVDLHSFRWFFFFCLLWIYTYFLFLLSNLFLLKCNLTFSLLGEIPLASETRLTNFKQQWRMEEKFMHRLIGFKKRGGNYRALITALFYHTLYMCEMRLLPSLRKSRLRRNYSNYFNSWIERFLTIGDLHWSIGKFERLFSKSLKIKFARVKH